MLRKTTKPCLKTVRLKPVILARTEVLRFGGRRLYHENVVDHYENPRNVGSLDKNDKNVGTGVVGAPACGDVLKIQIQVEDGVIVDSKFKAFGCGSAIASSSLATEWIKGKTLNYANTITNKEISKHLRLPPVKIHCSALSEDSIKAAIHDYKTKNNIP